MTVLRSHGSLAALGLVVALSALAGCKNMYAQNTGAMNQGALVPATFMRGVSNGDNVIDDAEVANAPELDQLRM